MSALPFDRVQITEEGWVRRLSLVEFLGMPLAQRIQWILGRQVEFFAGSELVERRQALQALRAEKLG